MEQPLILAGRLDANAARQLVEELAGRRGRPLTLDAGGIETASALALEVLAAARRQWRADGQPFTLTAGSARLVAALATLGLDPGAIGAEGAAGEGQADGADA